MRILEVLNARAFRLALAFSLAISVATVAAFGFIYWQVSSADTQRVAGVLVDEAAKSQDDSEAELRGALRLRLTRDLRQLDFVALFDSKGAFVFGNVPRMPLVPVDGRAHVVQERLLSDFNSIHEPAIFVARRLADGGALLLGRSLWDVYGLRETLLRALAIALLPTILLILAIGALFARRASQRFNRIQDAIDRIINGELNSRLPVANEDGDVDKVARAVNLMLDEIARLLEQLKHAGDNIAHDLRTPLAVARAKIERALESGEDIEHLRADMEAALAQIEKVSATISAILRIAAVENGARKRQFTDFDLAAICAQLLDFYEPLAESKGVAMIADADTTIPIRGDQDLMREALSNLIDNAIKFTPAGGSVRIEAGTADGLPFVLVSDTGVGVPPQERTRIFDRFYRGERSGQSPGQGLGLSIAETIANLHGFKLTVEDNDPGARFELRAAAAPALGTPAREPA
jgi:signal transduction histidine kinase